MVALVDPRNPSKVCHSCRYKAEESLADRTRKCPRCRLELNRDRGDSSNIKALRLQSLANSTALGWK